jgi:hypothetical protein
MTSEHLPLGQSFSRKQPGIDLLTLEIGTKVSLIDGSTAEILQNPRDGYWVVARFLTSPDASLVGREEMVLCYDLAGLME